MLGEGSAPPHRACLRWGRLYITADAIPAAATSAVVKAQVRWPPAPRATAAARPASGVLPWAPRRATGPPPRPEPAPDTRATRRPGVPRWVIAGPVRGIRSRPAVGRGYTLSRADRRGERGHCRRRRLARTGARPVRTEMPPAQVQQFAADHLGGQGKELCGRTRLDFGRRQGAVQPQQRSLQHVRRFFLPPQACEILVQHLPGQETQPLAGMFDQGFLGRTVPAVHPFKPDLQLRRGRFCHGDFPENRHQKALRLQVSDTHRKGNSIKRLKQHVTIG